MTAKTKQWMAFFGGIALSLALLGVFTTFNRSRPPGALAPLPAPSAPGTASRSAVELSSAQASSIKLQVASVTLQELVENLPVAATVVPDESRISHVHTRVAGWVEKLHVGNTGQFVRAGQPLVDIFSQELLASQLEYLAARGFGTASGAPPSAVGESGRARLRFFGMSEAAISAIEQSGKPQRVVTLFAPRPGIMARRGISAGTAVDPSTEIATVLDLSRVWLVADVPESAAAGIKLGTLAELAIGADGKRRIPAAVEFIDPLLSEATRTLKVRFSLPNPKGELRPGMYATAIFKAPPRRALTVPRDALVDTGSKQYVYVMTAAGAYEPRAVRVGARLKETVEIVEGLQPQEQVVVSGVFLLDSESRLRASGGQGNAHAGHGKAQATPQGKPPASVPAPTPTHPAGEAGHD